MSRVSFASRSLGARTAANPCAKAPRPSRSPRPALRPPAAGARGRGGMRRGTRATARALSAGSVPTLTARRRARAAARGGGGTPSAGEGRGRCCSRPGRLSAPQTRSSRTASQHLRHQTRLPRGRVWGGWSPRRGCSERTGRRATTPCGPSGSLSRARASRLRRGRLTRCMSWSRSWAWLVPRATRSSSASLAWRRWRSRGWRRRRSSARTLLCLRMS
mmetsp:Transcript_6615/g.12841  ORF Transcript_6615/g.12841 Transcript_6615/m.12841 type:complete len:218 (-) Transcript_6615:55-708(-)